MNNGSRLRKLLINTILFAVGQFGTTLLGVLLVPLYTKHMSTAEYGTADLVINMAAMFLPVATVSIVDGVVKFAMDGKHDKRQVFGVALLVCVCGFALTLTVFPLIQKYGQIDDYVLLFYLILATNILNTLFLNYTKALHNLKLYTILAITRTFVMLVSNIVMLTVLHTGVTGYLTSHVIANIASCTLAVILNRLWRKIELRHIDKATAKQMVTFSLPLVPNNFSNWAMSSIDKYMLTYMLGASYNGLYSVAHKIPSVVSIFSTVFNQAWNYSALEEQNSSNKTDYYQSVFRIYSSYLFIVASLVMCALKPVMQIWVDESFVEAWRYSPYLLIACIFSCFTGFYVPLFVTSEKTKYLFISTVTGAAVNCVLNLLLIPRWGINGASLATVITYFTVWMIRGVIIERYTDLHLKKGKAYVNAALLFLQGTLLILCAKYWIIMQLALFGIVLAVNRSEILVVVTTITRKAKQMRKK